MCFESNSLNVFLGIKLSKFLKPLEKLSISQVFSCLETVLRQVAPFLGKSEALYVLPSLEGLGAEMSAPSHPQCVLKPQWPPLFPVLTPLF